MVDPDREVTWDPGSTTARFRVPCSLLDSPGGRSLERWLEEWGADDPELRLVDGAWRVALPYSLWADAGRLPESEADPEVLDLFVGRHSAISAIVNRTSQHISIESIGHVGSPELAFLFSVDGARVGTAAPLTPFASDGLGRSHALVPCSFVAFERIGRWNARGETTRAEQIVFISELREHLDRSTAALAGAVAPFTFELDAHLGEFRAQRAGPVSLAWRPQKNAALFDLQLEVAGEDGAPRPLDLAKLDAQSPLIALSPTEHILLAPEVDAVARVARSQRNKLRKHVERHFANPSTLLPEGLALDAIDLSSYSPRVTGFAPIVTAERALDIRSSGVEWYRNDGSAGRPFITLWIAQPGGGGVATLQIATPAQAYDAVERLEAALAQPVAPLLDIGDRRVVPTLPLLDCIREDLAAFEAGLAAADRRLEDEPPKPARLAAVINEDVVRPARAVDEGAKHPVRWTEIEALMAPGVSLKDHQRTAVEWMWDHYQRGEHGVLLADDMGLGKTLQVAAFLALHRACDLADGDSGAIGPSMIVCPVILLDNWRAELGKFFKPEVFESLLVLYGPGLRRYRRGESLDVEAISAFDYVLTNYETLQANQQSLLQIDWHVVVLDEAQAIKNPDTYRARAARGLKRQFGICSTGTPVENRLSDLWALYDFLRPGDPFTTLEEFKGAYEDDLEEGIPRIREVLSYPSRRSSLLRRTKSDVLALPTKTVEVHAVAMTPRQVELERQITQWKDRPGKVLRILQDLQKLYQHPRLLLPDDERRRAGMVEAALEESPKLALCIDILRDIRAAREKALVFTLWTAMQELLVDVLKRELGLPRVRVINGDPAQRRHATRYIEELAASDGFDVMVLSPLAAGTGLTITAANHVIHYGRWWNPAKEDQATDRAYRIGQERPVHVHYPLLHHPGRLDVGFDVKLHGLVEAKRGVARDFLAPQSDDSISAEELMQMQED